MNMGPQRELEVCIDSIDDRLVADIVETLRPLNVQHWPRARIADPITILSVVGSSDALVNGLLALRKKLESAKNPVKVTISTEGARATLTDTNGSQIHSMLQTPAQERGGNS